MTTTKHTPGPWSICKRYRGQPHDETGIGNRTHAPIFTILCGTPERDANARLIAASPIMYTYVAARANMGDSDAKEIIASIGLPD